MAKAAQQTTAPTLAGRIGGLLGLRQHIAARTQSASERYLAMVRDMASDQHVDSADLEAVAASLGIPLAGIEADVELVAKRLQAVKDIKRAASLMADEDRAYVDSQRAGEALDAARAKAKQIVDAAADAARAASQHASGIHDERIELQRSAQHVLERTADPAIASRLASLEIEIEHAHRQPNWRTVPQPWTGFSQASADKPSVRMTNEQQIREAEQANDEMRRSQHEQIEKLQAERESLRARQMDPNDFVLPGLAKTA